jgi:hypothetical protein
MHFSEFTEAVDILVNALPALSQSAPVRFAANAPAYVQLLAEVRGTQAPISFNSLSDEERSRFHFAAVLVREHLSINRNEDAAEAFEMAVWILRPELFSAARTPGDRREGAGHRR